MGKGYEINWQMPSSSILTNPSYLQFQNLRLSSIDPALVQFALANMKPNADNAEIIAYLSWILRTIALLS